MRIHNTLTKQADEIEPLEGDTVRIYSCGPTVYDHIHIGNLSSFIFADTLRRTLFALGFKTMHVMNFTDVDDKTIARSREKYPNIEPMLALLKLTGEYTDLFIEDMKAVGNDVEALKFVKATDSIGDMQQFIRELVEQNFAYTTDDGVYFSIEKYKQAGKVYGQLANVSVDSTSQARIQNDEYDKETAHDFALWKTQKDNEPAWDFEIEGINLKGRPGWHIECSAMSRSSLGQPFDIHTGGIDLIFPHHENEIAQSTATGESAVYANVFAHNEHLLVDDQKMSKSLNNFYTLSDISDKGFSPLAFRLLVLQAHYRNQAHFSWDNLQAAQNRLNGYYAFAVLRSQTVPPNASNSTLQPDELEASKLRLQAAMEDDLKSPAALTELSVIAEQAVLRNVDHDGREALVSYLEYADTLLGLNLSNQSDISDAQKTLIIDREAARGSSDWAMSDSLRDQLAEQGIGLRDTDYGAIWFRL
jgi:cysteinyl-tRNA synthetase